MEEIKENKVTFIKEIPKKMISVVVPIEWHEYKDKHRLKWSYIIGKGILALKGDKPSIDKLEGNIQKMQMRLQQLITENWDLHEKIDKLEKDNIRRNSI